MPTFNQSLAAYAERIAGRNDDWKQSGLCRNQGERTRQWTVCEGETITIAGRQIDGRVAQERAAMVCFNCPVQWECVRHALEYDECAGVWGLTTRDMNWLSKQHNPLGIVDAARVEGVPVQRALQILKSRAPASPVISPTVFHPRKRSV